jgi:hypothetical protein
MRKAYRALRRGQIGAQVLNREAVMDGQRTQTWQLLEMKEQE